MQSSRYSGKMTAGFLGVVPDDEELVGVVVRKEFQPSALL